MDIIIDVGSRITPFGRASFQLPNTIYSLSHHPWLCIFAIDEQEPYLRIDPKVMPSIYFYRNYNRYKEHNNPIG